MAEPAEVVRHLREERKGWTQQRLAEEAGVSLGTVSNVETGKFNGRISSLRAIAETL